VAPGLAAVKEHASSLAAENGSCVLVTQHSDRLARGAGDAPGAADHLAELLFWSRRHGVALRSVQDDSTFTHPLLAFAMGERNYEDSRRKGEAVKSGLARRATRGAYNGGGRPYGYAWRERIEGGELVRDLVPDRAERLIVRRIFREFVRGKSQQAIARDLHRAAKTEWRQATLSGMLRNPLYVGRNRACAGGVIPPLLDEGTRDAAQQLIEATRRAMNGGRSRQPVGQHLFTRGMLTCGRCGGPMVPRSIRPRREGGRLYSVYLCWNRMRDADACEQSPVPREAATARGRYERVRRDYQDGRLDADDWREQRDELTGERDAADAQVDRLRSRHRELSSESITATINAEAAEWLTGMRRRIVEHVRGGRDIEGVRASLQAMFERFTLRCGQIDFTPREEAIAGWRSEPDPELDDVTNAEPTVRRVPLSYAGNSYSNDSPSQ
jgi:DNA invertase Pin-like site-specific DNA recombinase